MQSISQNQKISGYYCEFEAACAHQAGALLMPLDPGTFQQYALGPANYVTPIPEALTSEDAAPLLCAGVTT